jgi:hypothetical protein
VVDGLGDGQAGAVGEQLDDALREADGRVDASADRCSPERHLGGAGERRFDALDAATDLCGVAAELLAERHRGGVHQVRPAGLDDLGELLGLGLQ